MLSCFCMLFEFLLKNRHFNKIMLELWKLYCLLSPGFAGVCYGFCLFFFFSTVVVCLYAKDHPGINLRSSQVFSEPMPFPHYE